MTEERLPNTLARILARRARLKRRPTEPRAADAAYDQAIEAVRGKLKQLEREVERSKAKVDARYLDLVDQPEGRQATVLENSPPKLLLALAYRLMRESYGHRFDDPSRSLALASLANRSAQAVARSSHLSESVASDLLGESLDYLANALRITSDITGAERTFAEAERRLGEGTGDRQLRAMHLGLLGALRYGQGRAEDAADLWGREAALWRLLKDREKLGLALLNAGIAHSWIGELDSATSLTRDAVELVTDDRLMFLGLSSIAEALARMGDGITAWRLVSTNELILSRTELGEGLARRHRWVRGIVYRTLGRLSEAEEILTEVRDEYIAREESLRAAFASLDLLAVLAAQEKHAELAQLAEAAYGILRSERLDDRALTAFGFLRRAVRAERVTEELATSVANFLVRSRHDHRARFEAPAS